MNKIETEIGDYIAAQPVERQKLLTDIHHVIMQNDSSVFPIIEQMMGKEMIIYKANGLMKYALSSVKKHISLHLMPIYAHKPLHIKYEALLHKAAFQKGCINFNNEEEMPLDILQSLIKDCSTIDLAKIREDYLQSKKKK